MAYFLPLLALVAAVLWALQRRRRRHRLEKLAALIPGPPSYPLVGNALQVGTNPKDIFAKLFELYQKYGSLFRFWMGQSLHVCLMDPNDLQLFLSSSRHTQKGRVYDFLRPALGQGLPVSSGEKWRTHRKLLTPIYNLKILGHFLDIIDRKTSILIDQLKNENNGRSFNVYPYISLYSLDVMEETVMRLDGNAQTNPESAHTKAVKVAISTSWKRIISPWLHPDVIFKMSSTGVKQTKELNFVYDTVHNIIQKKRKEMTITEIEKRNGENGPRSNERHPDFLDLLLQERAAGGAFSDQDMHDEVTTFLAGHETTARALSFILWLLSTHQDIQDKVYNEVNSILSNNTESTINNLKEMKYLEAVVKEGVRLYPSVPLITRKINEDFVTKDGVVIPAGTNVIVPIILVNKHPEFYTEPETFIPERFLNNEGNSRHSFSYIPFSAGPRNCIGQRFSMLSLKASISKILLHYKLLPDVEFKPTLTAHFTIKSSNGVKIKISSRGAAHT